jgi:glycosyltransferase involved in cell wall biosynthesis
MQFVVAWYALNAAKIIKNIFKNNTVIDIHGILLGAILTIILNKIMRLNLPVVIHQDSANIFKIDQRSILTAKLAFLLFRISKPSRLVVVDDGNMLNQYLEILNNYKIRYETVDHAIDIDLYRPTMKNDIRDEFIILSTQRFIPFRRVDFCILAMKNLIERNINNRQIFKLILVGSGTDMAMLKNLAVLEEISDNITFAGQQNQQDVIEYLNIADVVIGTSLKTNLTLSTQEAMACGKPVVVFEAGRTNLLISHMENGLLANPGDPLDLAEKIEILYKDIHLRQTIGKNARKTIIENRDWKARVKKELAIYKNVLA